MERVVCRKTMRLALLLVGMCCAVVVDDCLLARSVTAYELAPPNPDWEYHLGQGLRLGDTGLTLGGYGSVRYENLRGHSPQLTVSALSLFISWDPGMRVRFFSELELEDLTVARGEHSFDSYNNAFEAERLYADVYLFDEATLRLGKFLTPVGRWNLIHADPLVWTTSRPLITSQPFAVDTTGGMLYGHVYPLGRDLDYSLYLEVSDDLDPNDREGPFSEAVGIHLATRLGSTELGFSYANFERGQERRERENLFGLDFFWARQRLELTGEFLYRVGTRSPDGDEWGLFAQGTVPLSERFFAIGRYEFFDPRGLFPGVHLWVAALAFRPLPPLILRAEYSFARDNVAKVPEGFATSIALLF
jgi:hypothetical protein